MKGADLMKLSVPELRGELAALREEARGLRFAAFTTKPKNVRRMRELRREIARVLTHLHVDPGTHQQRSGLSS